jgi:hypothetical protein
MPRWASRILLEVNDVLVVRLHELNDADAIACGIKEKKGNHGSLWYGVLWEDSPLLALRGLWEFIHGPKSWEKNPWVWVGTVKNITDTYENLD